MANEIRTDFTGDAGSLQQAAKQAEKATTGVADAATQATTEFQGAAQGSSAFTDRIGKLGAATSGAMDAVSGISDGLNAFVDLQNAAANRAAELARAQNDVEQALVDAEQATEDYRQAQLDLTQSQIDGRQAGVDAKQALIDEKQAALDAATAAADYAAAVKEHGKGSAEARQAAIDLEQAQADLQQAYLDSEQASADAAQAEADGRQALIDTKQATVDATGAQLDLNEAQRAANPSDLSKFMDQVNAVTPLLSALVGVVALATAAQWAWNIAMTANPVGLVIVAVAALIAVIVLIATKTTWFQSLWKAVWSAIVAYIGWVKDNYTKAFNAMIGIGRKLIEYVMDTPNRLKAAFSGLTQIITFPFRTAFNAISRAWNATVGQLRWSVPGWVPGIGGNSVGAPKLPTFHTGGLAGGQFGGEFMAVLRAGETVDATGGGGDGALAVAVVPGGGGSRADRALAEAVADLFDRGVLKLKVQPNGRVAVA